MSSSKAFLSSYQMVLPRIVLIMLERPFTNQSKDLIQPPSTWIEVPVM
jgi:hypothetical protein